jgi:hypothetical protein
VKPDPKGRRSALAASASFSGMTLRIRQIALVIDLKQSEPAAPVQLIVTGWTFSSSISTSRLRGAAKQAPPYHL